MEGHDHQAHDEAQEEEVGQVLTTSATVPRAGTSLQLCSLRVDTPVVLAPLAGLPNPAYRRLCAEQGAGLYRSPPTPLRTPSLGLIPTPTPPTPPSAASEINTIVFVVPISSTAT